MTFRVGQKVVCIRGPFGCYVEGKKQPNMGELYTIRAIYTDVLRPQYGVGLHLEEIENPTSLDGKEPGFYSSRFRPVVERKTDITVFTEILRKATKPARTPAMSQHHKV